MKNYSAVKFRFCYPNYSRVSFISSFFEIKLFMFICRKCKPFLFSDSQMLEFLSRDQFQIVPANSILE